MELYEHRIINGVLKSLPTVTDPDQALELLSQDIEIVADPERVSLHDLWPAIWALATVTSRQFRGRIFIRCGLQGSLPAPAPLSSRCVFTSKSNFGAIQIGLGIPSEPIHKYPLWGDVKGSSISHMRLLTGNQNAHPISCFALAGYLGFAALATVVGIPHCREDYITDEITMPFSSTDLYIHPQDGLAFLGLGQLGQAYLALLYFMIAETNHKPDVLLLDRDCFEEANWSTQILLGEQDLWRHKPKSSFLASELSGFGWNIVAETTDLAWGWTRPSHHPRLALLGFDNFDARRIVIEAGYDWLFEAGVGTSFLSPRVSWHSLPPERTLGLLFRRSENAISLELETATEFLEGLKKNTPGGCGWVIFNNISATAPSMGLVAAAFEWTEVLRFLQGERAPIEGHACLWSQLLPFNRVVISGV